MVEKISLYNNSDLQNMWKIKPFDVSMLFASLQNYVNYAILELNRYYATEEKLNDDARLKMKAAERIMCA